jgi:alpha-beta hydrolase superfamily lysophospholipase
MTPTISPLAAVLGRRLAGGLFHPPRRKHHREPVELGLPCTVRSTRTTDDVMLHLWLIPAEGTGAGVVIVGHGIGLTKSASLRHAALLHELGFHVILFDHRNHGLSGADRANDNLAERYSTDIEACLRTAAEMWPDAGAPIVWGFSFSTFPTLYSLRHRTSPPIRAIICDSGPGYELHQVLTAFLAGGGLPGPHFVSRLICRPGLVRAFAEAAIDMLGATWPPDPSTPVTATMPMLFLTGSADRIIEPAQVKAVAGLYPNATVVEYAAHHLRGITEAPGPYREAVTRFLVTLETGGQH